MKHEKHIPMWQLERYLLGELPPELKERVEKQLQSDESTRARLAALQESDREILSSYPPEVLAKGIERRYEETRPGQEKREREHRRTGFRSLALALSMAALVAIVMIPLRGMLKERQGNIELEGIRPKGLKAHLVIYRKRGDQVERLEQGEMARAGDVIQLSYVAGGSAYGAIFSIDGRGVVTQHLPDTEYGASPELDQSGEVSLAFAYELDDAPSFERFFFITSDESFDLGEVEASVHSLASNPRKARTRNLKLQSGFRQYSFILHKEEWR